MTNLLIDGQVHIPTNAPGLNTLCGFTDVMDFELTQDKPNCEECLNVLRWCRSLRSIKLAPQPLTIPRML